ncbi:MAG: ankyrin repeat domain-containing protein [Planctomycetota bacterium]
MTRPSFIFVVLIQLVSLCTSTTGGEADDDSERVVPESMIRALNGWVAADYFHHPLDIQLCEAIEANDLPAMKRALDEGANVNAVGRSGLTPLFWSSFSRKFERFEYLLFRGADPNCRLLGMPDFKWDHAAPFSVVGKSVTEWAARCPYDGYFQLCMRYGGNPDTNGRYGPLPELILWSRGTEKMEKFKAYLNAGGKINMRLSSGGTVAHQAIHFADFHFAFDLFGRGVNPHEKRTFLEYDLDEDKFVFSTRTTLDKLLVELKYSYKKMDPLSRHARDAKRLYVYLKAQGVGETPPKPPPQRFDPMMMDLNQEPPDFSDFPAFLDSIPLVRREDEPPITAESLRARGFKVQVWKRDESASPLKGWNPAGNAHEPPTFSDYAPLTEEQYRNTYGLTTTRFFENPKTMELCLAIERADVEALNRAIASGADVNDIGYAGMTPLLFAFPFERHEIMSTLLDAGADPTLRLTESSSVSGLARPGMSVLTEVATSGRAATFDLVVSACEARGIDWTDHDHWSGYPMLHSILMGVFPGQIQKVDRYVEASGDWDVTGLDKMPAIFVPVQLQNFPLALHLQKRGCDLTKVAADRTDISDRFWRDTRGNPLNTDRVGRFHPERYQSYKPELEEFAARLNELGLTRERYNKRMGIVLYKKEWTSEMIANNLVQVPEGKRDPRLPENLHLHIRQNAQSMRLTWYPRQRFEGFEDHFDPDPMNVHWFTDKTRQPEGNPVVTPNGIIYQ